MQSRSQVSCREEPLLFKSKAFRLVKRPSFRVSGILRHHIHGSIDERRSGFGPSISIQLLPPYPAYDMYFPKDAIFWPDILPIVVGPLLGMSGRGVRYRSSNLETLTSRNRIRIMAIENARKKNRQLDHLADDGSHLPCRHLLHGRLCHAFRRLLSDHDRHHPQGCEKWPLSGYAGIAKQSEDAAGTTNDQDPEKRPRHPSPVDWAIACLP
jgi:hypothetical protein